MPRRWKCHKISFNQSNLKETIVMSQSNTAADNTFRQWEHTAGSVMSWPAAGTPGCQCMARSFTMRTIIRTAIVVLSFTSIPALAAGGNGEPSSPASSGPTVPHNLVSDSSVFLLMRQAPAHRESASGRGAFSATTRNVGPGSSVTGYYESELGSAASGSDENPRAPAAGGTGMGGH